MTDTKTYPVSVAALLLVICAYHVNGLMCPAVFNGTSEQWCADCTHFVKPRCCAFSPNATCDDECNGCTVSWHCLAAAEGQTCEVKSNGAKCKCKKAHDKRRRSVEMTQMSEDELDSTLQDFFSMDSNGDHQISEPEFDDKHTNDDEEDPDFNSLDRNGNGVIGVKEFLKN